MTIKINVIRTILVFSSGMWVLVFALQNGTNFLLGIGVYLVFDAITYPIFEAIENQKMEMTGRLIKDIERLLKETEDLVNMVTQVNSDK